MRLALILAVCAMPAIAWAVGDEEDFDPPKPTETTEKCEKGLIWDTKRKACVAPQESSNSGDAMMKIARELAYIGRYEDARAVLDLLGPADPWVLTYRGFIARKTGNLDLAQAFYDQALALDPDHLLARSYMGQGYVAAGKLEAARDQLDEILRRGGRGTWPEVALAAALSTGRGYNY